MTERKISSLTQRSLFFSQTTKKKKKCGREDVAVCLHLQDQGVTQVRNQQNSA
jgi:hypothetical protein